MSTPKKGARKIYIAGPMTGIPGFNFAAFDAAKDELEEKGWVVVSPADVARRFGVSESSQETDVNLGPIQEQDIAELLECKAVFMLKGWENSKGARAEYGIAEWTKKEILFQNLGAPATNGVDPKGKVGETKVPLWLIPSSAMEEAAWAHKLGADKYGPWNWRSTNVKASTYISAALRHLTKWARRENTDPESKRHHLGHVIACCNILIDAGANNCLFDDRSPPPAE